MFSRTQKKADSLVAKTADLAFAVPQVIAHRMLRMAFAGPVHSARDRTEFKLMSDEKNAAFFESWNAMFLQAIRTNQSLTFFFMRSLSPWGRGVSANAIATELQKATLSVIEHGLAPVHSKALANARRLARTNLR